MMLMLVDTRDPRYHGPEPDGPGRHRGLPWRALLRVAAVIVAIVVAATVGGFAGYLVILLALAGSCLGLGGRKPPTWWGMRDSQQ